MGENVSNIDFSRIINKILNNEFDTKINDANKTDNKNDDKLPNIQIPNENNDSNINISKKCCVDGCNKKLGIMEIICKCGAKTCINHKYPDKHNCSYDYKNEQKQYLEKSNPVVVSSKINKI